MNEHIDNFLDYYYKFPFPTDYAVLIKGGWGTGKTWYIKNSLDKFDLEEQKYIYISLNGVTSFEEIENLFFQQLHPRLSSKGMTIAGKLAKGFLKATIKVDLDGDKKPDGSVITQIPDIDLPEYLTNTDGYILVFDDLERCSIKLCRILGYINHFVEQQGYKTIIIANEDEIIKRKSEENDDSNAYSRIKEKLIGQTFEVKPDIDDAITFFLNQLSEQNFRSFCISHKEVIKNLYLISEYKNLRHLKHALWGFERLYKELPDNAKDKSDLLIHLLQFYLIFSFEIKAGILKAEHIGILRIRFFSSLSKEDDSEREEVYKKILNKYTDANFYDILLDEEQWVEILDQGLIRIEKIQESLLKSNYFSDEQTPAWVKLWHAIDLSDEEFDTNMKILADEIKSKIHHDVGIIKHITGSLLWLSDIDVFGKDKGEILHDAKSYIDILINENLLINEITDRFRENESWGGLVFFGKEFSEFSEFCQYLQYKINEVKEHNYPESGITLLKLMHDNTQLFIRKLVPGHNQEDSFVNVPILPYIKPEDFVSTFLSLTPEQKQTVRFVFDERYNQPDVNNELISELEWLGLVKSLLVEHNETIKNKNKISRQIIKIIINKHIDEAIGKLQPLIETSESES